MKINSFPSIILVFSLLMSGCQSPISGESPIPATLPATMTAQSASTNKPTTVVAPTEIREISTATPDIITTIINTSSPRLHLFYPSHDGKWQVEVVNYDCIKVDPRENADQNSLELLKLIHIIDQTEVVVESILLYCGGLGAYGLDGLLWSPNSQYFYYTTAREGVPDGCGYWARPIKRVNIADRKTELIGGGYYLSPDNAKLALWRDNAIVIWGLDEGEITRAPALISEAFQNEIAWSPDGKFIVYLQTELECASLGKTYVILFSLSGMTQNVLIESTTSSFVGVTWDETDKISLIDSEGNQWIFNLVSKELTPLR